MNVNKISKNYSRIEDKYMKNLIEILKNCNNKFRFILYFNKNLYFKNLNKFKIVEILKKFN